MVQVKGQLEESEDKREELEESLVELKEGGTPRPDWGRCGRVVEGGEGRWRKVTKGRTSDQLVSETWWLGDQENHVSGGATAG